MDELKKINVKIEDQSEKIPDTNEHSFIKNSQIKNLSQFIKRQVMRLKKSELIEQHSVLIKDNIRKEISSSESEISSLMENIDENIIQKSSDHDNLDVAKNGRVFNIKSTKVLWDGKPSIMHVFIDTTNMIKLEEANNNIKLQRIMFTSISHEFRNPLNSIVNA